MEIKHHYNIALLDGDLLIIASTLPEVHTILPPAPVRPEQTEITPVSIINRMYRRETELPNLMQLWCE